MILKKDNKDDKITVYNNIHNDNFVSHVIGHVLDDSFSVLWPLYYNFFILKREFYQIKNRANNKTQIIKTTLGKKLSNLI